MNKREIIDDLLKDKPYLKCDKIYERDIDFIKTVISMEEWKDSKFAGLLTSTIWNNNASNIKTILSMEEWKNPKFEKLLTSTIWQSNASDIKTILSMEEWKDSKVEILLTSNIWKSNASDIKTILSMEELKDDKYKHLLKPSIFNISLKNISSNIELLKEYGIDQYITNVCLRRNVKTQRNLLEYLIENNIDLVVEGQNGSYKLNPIINATNSELKKKYGIDIKEIENRGKNK